jgi:hypothetical protein
MSLFSVSVDVMPRGSVIYARMKSRPKKVEMFQEIKTAYLKYARSDRFSITAAIRSNRAKLGFEPRVPKMNWPAQKFVIVQTRMRPKYGMLHQP